MSAGTCECACLGCEHFCGSDPPASTVAALQNRLLLALDRSIAAACRARGIEACDGIDADQPCEVGELHTRTAVLAGALADLIAAPEMVDAAGARPCRVDRVADAAEALAAALHAAFAASSPMVHTDRHVPPVPKWANPKRGRPGR